MTDGRYLESTSRDEAGGTELRPIPGVVGYAAGSDGRIYSFRAPGNSRWRYQTNPRPLSGAKGRESYLRVNLLWRGSKTRLVHRLVCEAFHGPCPAGMECSHLNGDPNDNRPQNLAWESSAENNRRKHDHGTHARPPVYKGDQHGRAVVSEEAMKDALCRIASGEDQGVVARDIGISRSALNHAWVGKTWSHIDAPRRPR